MIQRQEGNNQTSWNFKGRGERLRCQKKKRGKGERLSYAVALCFWNLVEFGVPLPSKPSAANAG